MTFSFLIAFRNVVLMFLLMTLMPVTLQAETVYVTDNLLVGLHEEKSIDSPILKVLPTGTSLEVIQRVGDFVNVRDPKGTTGWISNNYLMTNRSENNTGANESAAQSKIKQLEAELENLKLQTANSQQANPERNQELDKLKSENEKLQQQINSDKLKSGELQAKLAELRNQISQNTGKGQNNNLGDKELNEQLNSLTKDNSHLKIQVQQLSSGNDVSNNVNLLLMAGIIFLIGLIIGMIFMNRRIKKRLGGLGL